MSALCFLLSRSLPIGRHVYNTVGRGRSELPTNTEVGVYKINIPTYQQEDQASAHFCCHLLLPTNVCQPSVTIPGLDADHVLSMRRKSDIRVHAAR